MAKKKYVYFFGAGKAEGKGEMKNLLGGKGANLAEMTNLKIPVPAGFTITTEVCTAYYKNNKKYPPELKKDVENALTKVEKVMGKNFGDAQDPLLVSVRSGARSSMPGMMETVLNVGLTSKTIPGLIAKTNNERFVYDAYRRLMMMYADVVMEKAAGLEPEEGKGIRLQLEHAMENMKQARNVTQDTDLTVDDLKELCEIFKTKINDVIGKPFPDDAYEQLWGGIGAVFQSWNGKRAISYRRIEGIPDDWGTAVNVQSMVFGNTGETSATGVGFTRNPATGENKFYGEWLPNAQGEDVVAGIRTPLPINKAGKTEATQHLPSLEEAMPRVYKDLNTIRLKLEKHFRDMQDIEFTIQEGRLWMLQTRVGKRNGIAAIQMAVDMCKAGLISKKEAIMRVKPQQIDELLHPMIDPKAEAQRHVLAKGLPAGPGAGTGKIVFTADDAEEWAKRGEKVILVRNETSPEDVHGMHAAEAILTAKGGMTSHAALVARGWGKCCIVGCSALNIKLESKTISVENYTLSEGDWITLNGSKGVVYQGQIPLLPADPEQNKKYKQLMKWADEVRTLGIRTNADTPQDALIARSFGAEGIGLTRTEHMFFDPERIKAMREMIVAENEEGRRKAIMKLLPYQREDFIGIFEAMKGLPVTIRLLDPPLHEFVGLNDEQITELAAELEVPKAKLESRIAHLHELNPMLGHRGCRLGITYPEISEMQARAIFEAAATLTQKKIKVFPEVMIPLVGSVNELAHQKAIVARVALEVQKEMKVKFPYLIGTMIEIPRACVVADKIAEQAEFFSFGTNDLTQTTIGFSRDDTGSFLPEYLTKNILPHDPFQILDQEGVGELVAMGVKKGRSTKPDLKIGICGEHGGDPSSIEFCHRVGMNYVSCSPFRVPIARLAAAQAAVTNEKKTKKKK
ncbi:MAG: pyruvate, phosphate dikinase [Thermodesulfobacteriota bacterium]|jgi:pyruvate,orthophosphate dikinase|nr:MAG: pyruvate, phosphate dikinase [Thermodesulfobacteriota bacterium]